MYRRRRRVSRVRRRRRRRGAIGGIPRSKRVVFRFVDTQLIPAMSTAGVAETTAYVYRVTSAYEPKVTQSTGSASLEPVPHYNTWMQSYRNCTVMGVKVRATFTPGNNTQNAQRFGLHLNTGNNRNIPSTATDSLMISKDSRGTRVSSARPVTISTWITPKNTSGIPGLRVMGASSWSSTETTWPTNYFTLVPWSSSVAATQPAPVEMRISLTMYCVLNDQNPFE